MQKVGKINLKVLDVNDKLGESCLKFKLEGTPIDYIVANTIRRTMLADIPIYAFSDFKFDKNTSVLHNDYLKNRFRNLPVWVIENTIDFIDSTMKNKLENKEEDIDDEVDLEVQKKMNTSSLKQLTMYVNYKNKTNDIISVTTNDAKFYYDEKQIDSPYKVAVPLTKLQPNQEIAFSAITNIGTESEHSMFSACCTTSYNYSDKNPNMFDFEIESRGQITEKRILLVSLNSIIKRMENFIKLLKDDKTIENSENEGMIVVNNEDHTLGNLIARGMQQHNMILFAGYNLPHPRVSKVQFHYKHEKGTNIMKIMDDVVEYYMEIFNEIKKLISKEL